MPHRLPDWAQNVSRETFSKLEAYVALLQKWNEKINLIGPASEADIWSRHIADSLQLVPLIPPAAKTLADFGSGAGLPGIVLAIRRPDIHVTLVEQDQRKAAFLLEARRILDLQNAQIASINISRLEGHFDVITARALAALDELMALAIPRLGKNSICLFPKGENFASEIAQAERRYGFTSTRHSSKTNDKSCVISVSELIPKDGNQ